MKTTNFFIELLVIGIGAVICLISIFYLIIGDQLLHLLQKLDSPLFILPMTAIVYVLGIVFDRLFDTIISKKDKVLRSDYIEDDEYNVVKSSYYDDSAAVRQVFDYTKSRIRITRSWMFYFFIIFILSIIYAISSSIGYFYLVGVVLLLLSWLTYFSWKKLTISFNGLLKTMYTLMTSKKQEAT
ncbi:MAG: hypothetical protein HKN86_01455 [Acidimicrobiia bacterium]|nr:hypothetical protein [Acidimicrobiia bacterium]